MWCSNIPQYLYNHSDYIFYMEFKELEILDLTKGGVKVYSAILNNGISSINDIHERTGLERRAIYDIINKLIEKGIITYVVEKGRRKFQCAPPNKLMEELNIKKQEILNFEKIIPSIKEIYTSSRPKISSEVFRGAEGIKAVWEDMLNCKDVFWIGSGRYMPKNFPHWFSSWNNRRVKLKVKWFNLLRYELKQEVKALPYEFVKFLPEEFSGNPTVIGIYGNKVVNFLFSEQFFAFSIENKELADNYRRYHKYLWDNVAKAP